jgi:hypothetical protein
MRLVRVPLNWTPSDNYSHMLCVKNAGDVADLKAVLADSLVYSPIGCHLLIKTNRPNFCSRANWSPPICHSKSQITVIHQFSARLVALIANI